MSVKEDPPEKSNHPSLYIRLENLAASGGLDNKRLTAVGPDRCHTGAVSVRGCHEHVDA